MNNGNLIIEDNGQFDDESGDNVGMNALYLSKKHTKAWEGSPCELLTDVLLLLSPTLNPPMIVILKSKPLEWKLALIILNNILLIEH